MDGANWLKVVLAVMACVVVRFLKNLWTERRSLPPGPLPWPIVGNLPQLGGVPHQKLAELAMRYGPLMYVKFGSKGTLVVSSPRYAEEVLKNQDINWASRPLTAGSGIMMYDSNDIIFSPRWRFYRSIMMQELITSRRVKDFKRSRQEETLKAIKWSLKECSKSVDLGFIIRTVGMNTGTRMLMNEGLLSEKAYSLSKTHEFDKAATELTELLGTPYIGDLLPWLDVFDIGGIKKKMRSVATRLDAFFQTVLDDHKRKLEVERDGNNEAVIYDMIDAMLLYKRDSDNRKLEDREIKGIIQTILVASIDTTANTVEWAFSELMRHPEVMERLQAEMDSVVGRDRLADESDLTNLPYLQAVVNETFRLHPVVPMLIPHLSSKSCTIDGYSLPAGTQLLVNVWAIHRDPAVWDRPHEFDPSRFLDYKADVHWRNFELMPFGYGRRMCPAKPLAILQTAYIVALLVQTCEWRLPEGMRAQDVDMEELTGLSLPRLNPLRVKALPRISTHLLHIGE